MSWVTVSMLIQHAAKSVAALRNVIWPSNWTTETTWCVIPLHELDCLSRVSHFGWFWILYVCCIAYRLAVCVRFWFCFVFLAVFSASGRRAMNATGACWIIRASGPVSLANPFLEIYTIPKYVRRLLIGGCLLFSWAWPTANCSSAPVDFRLFYIISLAVACREASLSRKIPSTRVDPFADRYIKSQMPVVKKGGVSTK